MNIIYKYLYSKYKVHRMRSNHQIRKSRRTNGQQTDNILTIRQTNYKKKTDENNI